MNIIVIREKLKEGLDAISRISSEHPTLPILKNVLIEVKEEKITLTATNLEIGVKYSLSGKVVRDGNVTVPVALFAQIVSNLVDERIELLVDGSNLQVISESYKAELQGSPASEFPSLPKIENTEEYIELDSAVFRSSLENTLSATQFSELRPELSSIYFQFFGDRLVLVATDSFRLAEKTLNSNQFTSTTSEEFKVLIPLRSAQELVRILKEKGSVRVYRDQSQILFKTEKVDLVSRLLDGTFPDYQAVIPKDYEAEISLDRDEFLSAVKLAGVMSGASLEIVLRSGDKDHLEIFSRDEKLGENSYKLGAKTKGTFTESNFNWKYLIDGVKALSPKEFLLSLNDNNRPAMLKSRQDASYFYILMPILKG